MGKYSAEQYLGPMTLWESDRAFLDSGEFVGFLHVDFIAYSFEGLFQESGSNHVLGSSVCLHSMRIVLRVFFRNARKGGRLFPNGFVRTLAVNRHDEGLVLVAQSLEGLKISAQRA